MKRTILMIAGALALAAANVQADNPQIVIHSTHAEEDARADAAFKANEKQTFESLYHRIANSPHGNKVEQMYSEWVSSQLSKRQPKASVGELTQGDPIPLKDDGRYDDTDTVRIYLHDSGYPDVSNSQIANVRTYMLAHGIRHVSELGQ